MRIRSSSGNWPSTSFHKRRCAPRSSSSCCHARVRPVGGHGCTERATTRSHGLRDRRARPWAVSAAARVGRGRANPGPNPGLDPGPDRPGSGPGSETGPPACDAGSTRTCGRRMHAKASVQSRHCRDTVETMSRHRLSDSNVPGGGGGARAIYECCPASQLVRSNSAFASGRLRPPGMGTMAWGLRKQEQLPSLLQPAVRAPRAPRALVRRPSPPSSAVAGCGRGRLG